MIERAIRRQNKDCGRALSRRRWPDRGLLVSPAFEREAHASARLDRCAADGSYTHRSRASGWLMLPRLRPHHEACRLRESRTTAPQRRDMIPGEERGRIRGN